MLLLTNRNMNGPKERIRRIQPWRAKCSDARTRARGEVAIHSGLEIERGGAASRCLASSLSWILPRGGNGERRARAWGAAGGAAGGGEGGRGGCGEGAFPFACLSVFFLGFLGLGDSTSGLGWATEGRRGARVRSGGLVGGVGGGRGGGVGGGWRCGPTNFAAGRLPDAVLDRSVALIAGQLRSVRGLVVLCVVGILPIPSGSPRRPRGLCQSPREMSAKSRM